MRNRSRRKNLISQINVTPMVDVMLVLLVIFMVTSPIILGQIQIELPSTESSNQIKNIKPIVITINKKEEIFLYENKVSKNSLMKKLNKITKKDSEVFIKGDKNLQYGIVIHLMSDINKAGFTKLSLISEAK